MHIVIVELNAHHPGHYSQEIESYCNHLQKYNVKVDVLTPYGFKEPWQETEKCKVYNLLESEFMQNKLVQHIDYTYYDFQFSFYQRALIFISSISEKPIIHIWDYKSVLPLWYYFKNLNSYNIICNLKTVYRAHKSILGLKIFGQIQESISFLLLRSLASKYVVHTKELFDQAINIKIPPQKIEIIKIGFDQESIQQGSRNIKYQFNLDNNSVLVLFFGSIREEKGILELLNIWKDITSKYKLLIVGVNKIGKNLIDKINELNLMDRVITFFEYINKEEIDSYFLCSDIVIICHKKEFKGQSGVFLNALQYEIPIVATDNSDTAREIKNHKIGELFNITSYQSLNIAFDTLLLRKDEVILNIKKMKSLYSWRNQIENFIKLYKSFE